MLIDTNFENLFKKIHAHVKATSRKETEMLCECAAVNQKFKWPYSYIYNIRLCVCVDDAMVRVL